MNDKTVVMEWWYATPCGSCGQYVRIERDASRGKSRFSTPDPVKAKCRHCGHEESYPATAVDNKLMQ